MNFMNTESPSPARDVSSSAQRLVDRQMTGILEAILAQSFSLANRGLIPSDAQLAAYVDSLDEGTLLQKIRRHPGAAATLALAAEDAQLLRWARLVGR